MSTQFCDRYRERNVPNPREMLALRNTPVDLTKWMPVSFGHTPPSKLAALTAKGYVIIECATDFLTRTARRYRKGSHRNGLTGVMSVFRHPG